MMVSTLILVGSLLFGCLMLAIGLMTGLWIAALNCPTRSASQPDDSADTRDGLALQPVLMFSSSLIRLAQTVSGDLRAHSTKIQAISAGLLRSRSFSAPSKASYRDRPRPDCGCQR